MRAEAARNVASAYIVAKSTGACQWIVSLRQWIFSTLYVTRKKLVKTRKKTRKKPPAALLATGPAVDFPRPPVDFFNNICTARSLY